MPEFEPAFDAQTRAPVETSDVALQVEAASVPEVLAEGQGGLLDVKIGPFFCEDRMIYLTYAKPVGDGMSATAAGSGARRSDAQGPRSERRLRETEKGPLPPRAAPYRSDRSRNRFPALILTFVSLVNKVDLHLRRSATTSAISRRFSVRMVQPAACPMPIWVDACNVRDRKSGLLGGRGMRPTDPLK